MKKFPILTGIVCISALCVLALSVVPRQRSAFSAADSPLTIVIDAGHGGEDGGATGVGASRESDLNLQISLRLEQILSFCGFRTGMIRTTDRSVYSGNCATYSEKKVSDLKNRVKMVEQTDNAMLISIHQNHFPQEKYSGAQVFYGKAQGSEPLATLLQNSLRLALNPNNRRSVKEGTAIYLLEEIRCPGVLVECGFLSNRQEELLLQEAEYQQKIVCAITKGVIEFTRGVDDREV